VLTQIWPHKHRLSKFLKHYEHSRQPPLITDLAGNYSSSFSAQSISFPLLPFWQVSQSINKYSGNPFPHLAKQHPFLIHAGSVYTICIFFFFFFSFFLFPLTLRACTQSISRSMLVVFTLSAFFVLLSYSPTLRNCTQSISWSVLVGLHSLRPSFFSSYFLTLQACTQSISWACVPPLLRPCTRRKKERYSKSSLYLRKCYL